MIRGYFGTIGARQRPFIDAVFHFAAISNRSFQARLLVDTGADRTILGTLDANRLRRQLGIDISSLSSGAPSRGVGGQTPTRIMEGVLSLDTFTRGLTLPILHAPSALLPVPSLLGRDILSYFALFMEERTRRVLLLEPHEADALHL